MDQFYRNRPNIDLVSGFCRKCHGASTRRASLRRKYGITQGDYDAMMIEQGGRCGICQTLETPNRGRPESFHIDHDHKTGKVRGLLCAHCNLLIGNAMDRADVLEAAIKYLQKHSALMVPA